MSSNYDEGRIVTRRSGRRLVTPLFLALVAIGTTDLLFAFDSIPAVFGVTDHGYIVFAANAFALLGLRPLYFLVSGLLSRLVYLSTGLAIILAFIGVKLILEFAHQQNHSIPELPTLVSLAVIIAVLATTTIASVIKSKRDPALRAHAGALRQTTDPDGAADAVPSDRQESDEVRPVA
jgi:tellurite resistance protein TerC